jgi:hypothetical protein
MYCSIGSGFLRLNAQRVAGQTSPFDHTQSFEAFRRKMELKRRFIVRCNRWAVASACEH